MGRLRAIFFDCDGVIAETERDGHRVAFNRAFLESGIDVKWSDKEYKELVKVAGGKERMKSYFKVYPEKLNKVFGSKSLDDAVNRLHSLKTRIFIDMCERGELPIRPGIERIVEQAMEEGIGLAVCSTSNEKSVRMLVKSTMGEVKYKYFDRIFAGDLVNNKKPAPDIYILAKNHFNLHSDDCLVIEDSRNGLLAAKTAGMHCVITTSYYSKDEDFSEADLVVSTLGDVANPAFILSNSRNINKNTRWISLNELKAIVAG